MMLSIVSSTPKQYPFLELRVVSVGQILAEKENSVSRQHLKHTRDEKRDSPCCEFGRAHFQDEVENQGHDQLRRTPTEVSPASCNPVCRSDNRSGEQRAHPKLGGHKCRQGETGEESDEEKRDSGVGDRSAVNRRCGQKGQSGGSEAGPEQVAHGPHGDSSEHCTRNCRNSRISYVGCGEIEIVSDDRQQRRGRKSGDETSEEGNPGEMECTHVGCRH